MLTTRCTKKLLDRLRVSPEATAPPSTTVLGDWYANLVYFGRQQLVLFSSERSLLPVLVEAKDSKTLFERFRQGLARVLASLDVPPSTIAKELGETADITITKTASRTVLGMMNDFAFMAEVSMSKGESLVEVALFLAETPCSPIKGFPCDLTRTLFGLPPIKGKKV